MTTEIGNLSATAAVTGQTMLVSEERSQEDPESFDLVNFWMLADLFVYTSASVANFFLPGNARKKNLARLFPDRGSALCAMYGVDQGHFEGVSKVRHSFAHVDERYEEFWQEDPNRNIGSRLYVEESSMGGAGPWARFHGFDPATSTLTFGGDAIDVRAVVATMQSISERTEQVKSALAREVAMERGRT